MCTWDLLYEQMIDLNNSYKYWNSLMTKGVFQRNVKVEPLKYSWKVVNPKSESYLLSNPSLLSGRDECIYITVLSAGIEPLCCFVVIWLLAYVSDFCFQAYFKNADSPWKAAINAVRRRNQANSTVPQPLLLGIAQPHSRKRVGFPPQEAAKWLFWW